MPCHAKPTSGASPAIPPISFQFYRSFFIMRLQQGNRQQDENTEGSSEEGSPHPVNPPRTLARNTFQTPPGACSVIILTCTVTGLCQSVWYDPDPDSASPWRSHQSHPYLARSSVCQHRSQLGIPQCGWYRSGEQHIGEGGLFFWTDS